jgi:hypothetical protein
LLHEPAGGDLEDLVETRRALDKRHLIGIVAIERELGVALVEMQVGVHRAGQLAELVVARRRAGVRARGSRRR